MNNAYIELMKKVLIDYHRVNLPEYRPINFYSPSTLQKLLNRFDKIFQKRGYYVCQKQEFTEEKRNNGLDWPTYADSMIGLKRMNNLQYCVEQVVQNNIPGDLIETGVWRGGATIFMKAILNAYSDTSRKVFVADSFEGLPKPDEEKYEADKGDWHYVFSELAIPLEQVQYNFKKYDLLDERVIFLKGWFKDTLPKIESNQFALLRLDGDMYESTMDALTNLYHKLSKGGYIIIDDYHAVEACKKAVHDYREKNGIQDEIITIDQSSVYWQKR